MIVLLIVGTGLTLSLYSIFLPFIQTLWDIKSYNMAYYAAVSSVERAQLVLKYHQPWFEGSGGRLGSLTYGPVSDQLIDHPFGFVTQWPNGLKREIISRTSTLPGLGQSDIPLILRGTGSDEYLMLEYNKPLTLFLQMDVTSAPIDYYIDNVTIQWFNGDGVTGVLRLPGLIADTFGGLPLAQLCTSCDDDGDTLTDDLIAAWKVDGVAAWDPFSIIPTNAVFYNEDPALVDVSEDTSIRKSTINAGTNTLERGEWWFANASFNPVKTNTDHSATGHNMISNTDLLIGNSFRSIFQDGSISGLQLSLSLMSLLKTSTNQIYPFLEGRFVFGWWRIADTVYRIQGIGKVGDYQVSVLVNKPSSKASWVGSFTIIF